MIIIAGVLTLATRGIPKGVEFAGGTVVIEQFEQAVSVQQVRQALDRNYPGGGQYAVVTSYGDPSEREVMIRVPQVGAEAGAALISAGFLFQFGTGPIRGFAVTLSVGLLSNLFTSTFVSKTLFELALAKRHQVATLSI